MWIYNATIIIMMPDVVMLVNGKQINSTTFWNTRMSMLNSLIIRLLFCKTV